MQAQILSQTGLDITVKFTFDDGSVSTQTIHYEPDPSSDSTASLVSFLRAYANAYVDGLAQVQAPVIALQTLTL